MMIATMYKLNEEGKTFDGMQLIISDWFKNFAHEHSNCEYMKECNDLNIVLHPETYEKLRRSCQDQGTFRFSIGFVTNGRNDNLPITDAGVKMLGLQVKCSITTGKDELIIISDGLLELFEKFAERVHKEGYYKGKLDAFKERRF